MIGLVTSKTVEVYSEPRGDADVIGHIAEGNLVEVDDDLIVGKFYKICTAMGLEGYCKKKYISIEK